MDSIWCQPPAFCPAIRRKPHPERLRSVLQYHAFVIRRTERLKRWHMGRALKLHHKISSPLDCYYCKYTFRTCWTSLGMQEIWPKTFRKKLSIVNKQGKIGKWKLSKYLSVLQVCSHCKHWTQCFTPKSFMARCFAGSAGATPSSAQVRLSHGAWCLWWCCKRILEIAVDLSGNSFSKRFNNYKVTWHFRLDSTTTLHDIWWYIWIYLLKYSVPLFRYVCVSTL